MLALRNLPLILREGNPQTFPKIKRDILFTNGYASIEFPLREVTRFTTLKPKCPLCMKILPMLIPILPLSSSSQATEGKREQLKEQMLSRNLKASGKRILTGSRRVRSHKGARWSSTQSDMLARQEQLQRNSGTET